MPPGDLVTTSPFADFPEDVVRLIFEWAAEDGNWNTALICWSVKEWVEPILYRVIVLKSWLPMERLVNTIQDHSTKTKGFFSTHVKSFSVTTCSSMVHFATIIKACSGLVLVELPLVIQRGELGLGAIGPLWASSSLRQLLITPSAFYPHHRNFRRSVFQNLTHLEFSYPEEDGGWKWDGFKGLTCLTHFCLNPSPAWYFSARGSALSHYQRPLEVILPLTPPSLVVFMVLSQFRVGGSPVANLSNMDIRIVVALDRDSGEHDPSIDSPFIAANTILRRAVGNHDHWERAEEVILQRQSGLRKWPVDSVTDVGGGVYGKQQRP